MVSEAESEPESRSSSERDLTPEERTHAQIDVRWHWRNFHALGADIRKLRAKQQAALERRFAAQQKKGTVTAKIDAQTKKKPTALEQASRENVGYRNMDAQVEFRSWN